ncbi:hypothetical protein ACQ86B_09030 [Mycolicibacterium aichiense]|uniref:hypothetical protein n=1 Tax=Mycolicibacterium aichiense TaxID=1799 RepID=UPI003D66E154
MNLVAAWLAIIVATAALAHRWRDKALRLCMVAIGSSVGLAVTFLLTGPSVPAIFERAAKAFGGTVIAAILSVVVVVAVLPACEAGPTDGQRPPCARYWRARSPPFQ